MRKLVILIPLVCLISVVSSSYASPYTPLGSPCKQNNDCGALAYCNEKSVCACRFGDINSDGTDCSPLHCFADAQCDSHFGPGSKCQQGVCNCDVSFKLDQRTQACVPTKDRLHQTCVYHSDCGQNAFCYYVAPDFDGHCKCKFGNIQAPFNDVNCDPMQCYTDSDCVQFSTYVQCSNHNCVCVPGTFLDPNKQICFQE